MLMSSAFHARGARSAFRSSFTGAAANYGNRAYYPSQIQDADDADLLEAFMGQFYAERQAPKLVLLGAEPGSKDLLAEALSVRAGRKVEIRRAQRGEARQLVAQAELNARQALARRLAESSAQAKLLQGLADALDLADRPNRIEIYDNSHIQGTDAVGAFVVAGPEGLDKSGYRKFTIKNADLTPGDDFGMMREVLGRRFFFPAAARRPRSH